MSSSRLLETRSDLPEGPWLVCGLARSGQSAAAALVARGERVIGIDASSPEGASALSESGVEVHLDTGGEEFVSQVTGVVKSPGVPNSAPAVRAARELGVPVLGELELGWRMTSGQVIAVTGTNGKTTTTELIGHLLRESGEDCSVVGNVGTPISSVVGTEAALKTLVVEASSFQLEDSVGFAPEVAVLLNLGADHIDRHGTVASYREAKLRIFDRQSSADTAVVPEGEKSVEGRGDAKRVTFGGSDSDMKVSDGGIYWRGVRLADTEDFGLPGEHNLLNAQAAAAACLMHGTDPGTLADGLRTFEAVPHRLQLVSDQGGVRWYNDSKATNVDSTLTALKAVGSGVHLILGGDGKGQDFLPLRAAVAGHCVSVHLIGEAEGQLFEVLSESGVHVQQDGDLKLAVASCARTARSGESVLLSPACASFDQFRDFEHRGEEFCSLVEASA